MRLSFMINLGDFPIHEMDMNLWLYDPIPKSLALGFPHPPGWITVYYSDITPQRPLFRREIFPRKRGFLGSYSLCFESNSPRWTLVNLHIRITKPYIVLSSLFNVLWLWTSDMCKFSPQHHPSILDLAIHVWPCDLQSVVLPLTAGIRKTSDNEKGY